MKVPKPSHCPCCGASKIDLLNLPRVPSAFLRCAICGLSIERSTPDTVTTAWNTRVGRRRLTFGSYVKVSIAVVIGSVVARYITDALIAWWRS